MSTTSRRRLPAYSAGSVTDSSTDLVGSSSESWKTNPNMLALKAERSPSETAPRSCPAYSTAPRLGVSMRPRMYRRVDLPLPDGPVSAVTAPGSNECVSLWISHSSDPRNVNDMSLRDKTAGGETSVSRV